MNTYVARPIAVHTPPHSHQDVFILTITNMFRLAHPRLA